MKKGESRKRKLIIEAAIKMIDCHKQNWIYHVWCADCIFRVKSAVSKFK